MNLIDKDAVVAEIESKRKYAQTLGDNAINGSMQQFYDGMKQGCVDILSFINTLEVKEVGLNYNKKTAILLSSHQEVARLFADSLEYVMCMAVNPNAEDLLKVIDITGRTYWCDEIEFIENE